MPLRDHFRPPISKRSSWEGFHGGWPMVMVQRLAPLLPKDFTAEPRVHLGAFFEIGVCASEDEQPKEPWSSSNGGPEEMTTATAAPQPTLTLDAKFDDQYEYEVLVYDHSRGRHLVAAVEIVSPANKGRPENRIAFITKCAALLQKGVCVSIVDLVTALHFNLYSDLLDHLGRTDPLSHPIPRASMPSCVAIGKAARPPRKPPGSKSGPTR